MAKVQVESENDLQTRPTTDEQHGFRYFFTQNKMKGKPSGFFLERIPILSARSYPLFHQ